MCSKSGNNHSASLTAIVLAGGQSSRMGEDKALISFQDVPLLRRVSEIAIACVGEVYVVTPWLERYQGILPRDCQLIQEVPLPGETKPHGPLVGFAQGLAHLQADWVLLLACDLPWLHQAEVQEWMGNLTEVSEEVIAFLPRGSKGWEPLCGFYRRECLPLLNDFINRGGRSFQRWLSQHLVQELPVRDTQVLFNCNTPEELEQLKIKN
ncbi:MAG: molybdenum cofactor guanylyltransferase [Cyanobacteria bacterium QH_6_48_35]|nr:MAG: molybdenum cofactor guanylyltransferase [Cyanobacteria bacterium QH_1_48_107]PSO63492.1 MAG: molybdenum cofactor guanylyltransferase [Cyanobacteria bacterium QH_2_48_84]PSO65318.1 MAG: molybdenum cofactor guanylyltransferase [Cyanobacteria bacterium QH_6_48_35]